MNNNDQAKNGFKTFVITFAISVLIFGVFYYVISDASTSEVSIEDSASTNSLGYTKKQEPNVKGAQIGPSPSNSPSTAGPDMAEVVVENKTTVFGDLASNEVSVQERIVLAGATESTESTVPVPETGDISITFGIVSSISLLAFFVYLVVMNPRKYALAKFEKEVLEDLK